MPPFDVPASFDLEQTTPDCQDPDQNPKILIFPDTRLNLQARETLRVSVPGDNIIAVRLRASSDEKN